MPLVQSCADPAAPSCAPHGKCQDATGEAVCSCDPGYAGATCTACAAGFQDNDGDGTCSPDCSTSGLACTPHSKCVDATGTAACACAVGYALDGAVCTWHGGPLDPTLEKKPDAWIVAGGVVVDPVATGGADPGMARFNNAAVCQTYGTLRQTFAMPSYADAEPLALNVNARSNNCIFCNGPVLPIGTNGGYSFVPLGRNVFAQQRVCLGERAYGGQVELVVMPAPGGEACTLSSAGVDVDHVSIDVAPDCPAPGHIANSDFEGTGGWSPSGTGAEVATAVGTGGSRAGRVFTTNLCQGPSLTGSLSAPYKALSNPALTASYKGTTGKTMRIFFGTNVVADVDGNATFQSMTACIPAKGVVSPLVMSLPVTGGMCANPDVREFVFDDLKIVSDPTCPSPAYVIDGGFEKETGLVQPWVLESPTYSVFAWWRSSTSNAHTGTGSLLLGAGQPCNTATATQTITIPDPVGTAGPAVKFWYKLPTVVNATFSSSPGGTLTPTATYAQKTVCLDPKLSGRGVPFVLKAFGGNGTCANTYSVEEAWFDDVEVTTDPSCPAQ